MSKLTTRAFDMAGQENCDSAEYDMIQTLADRVVELEDAFLALWLMENGVQIAEYDHNEFRDLIVKYGKPETNGGES
jgi:hypothetical protein